MGEDARGTIASMKASREKRDPVVCFFSVVGFWGEFGGFRFLEPGGFGVVLMAGCIGA